MQISCVVTTQLISSLVLATWIVKSLYFLNLKFHASNQLMCWYNTVVTTQLISSLVLATWIVKSLYFLNPKFHASNQLLCWYSPVCVGPGWKSRKNMFSLDTTHIKGPDQKVWIGRLICTYVVGIIFMRKTIYFLPWLVCIGL